MPRKNIYVKEEDLEVFEEAEELNKNKSLSETIANALADYIQTQKGLTGKISQQMLEISKAPREGTSDRYVRFKGFQLGISMKKKEEAHVRFSLYQGMRGRLLLHRKMILERSPEGIKKWKADYIDADEFSELKEKVEKRDWQIPSRLQDTMEEIMAKRIIEDVEL